MLDNYSQWEAHDAKQESWRNSRPYCCYCYHHIQDERLMNINGSLYHIDCAEMVFGEDTDDYAK